MSANTATIRRTVRTGEEINEAVDIKGLLDLDSTGASSEKATGTPTITERNTSALTITNKAVNTANKVIEGKTRVAGEAIQFTVTGFVKGIYKIDISFVTDATPPQKRKCTVEYEVQN